MSQSPSKINPGSPADEIGISYAVLLAGVFLVVLCLVLMVGIIGPKVGLGGETSPTSTPQPALYSANAPEVPKANETASLSATEVNQIERLIVAYANAERADYNHPPLVRNPNLANISRSHSYNMAIKGFYSHYDLNGTGPIQRANMAKYSCPAVAENILTAPYNQETGNFYGDGFRNFTTYRALARGLVGRWMVSGGHRWGILSPRYDVIGVGVYAKDNDQVYATMMLCDRRNWPDTPPEGMDAPVAEPGADYNESYWEPYPDSVNASWDDDPPSATPTPA